MSFRLFPFIGWFVYDWRNLKKFFSNFCWNLFQLSTRIASTCGYCSVSVSFLVSILFIGLSLFYVVSLSFKRQTFSFTACSTSLPDSLLFLFNLPLNVNHSKKISYFLYWWFKQKNISSIKRLANLQLLFHSVFFWTQNDTFVVINFFRIFLRFIFENTISTKIFCLNFEEIWEKVFSLSLFFFGFKGLLQMFQEPFDFDIMWYCL